MALAIVKTNDLKMMTGNLPRSLTLGALVLGLSGAVSAEPIAFNGSTDLTSNQQTDLMRIDPQGRYLYSYSAPDEQIEALEIIEETGTLRVPSDTSTFSGFDGLVSVEDMAFNDSGRFLFLANSDPASNGGLPLKVLRRGPSSEEVDSALALNEAIVSPTGDDCGLTADHQVHTLAFASLSDGDRLFLGTLNTATSNGELLECEIVFSPDSGEDIEMTLLDTYNSSDIANLDLSNPRDLKIVGGALYYSVGDPANALVTLESDSDSGGLSYVSHVQQGPAVDNALCNPGEILFTNRYSEKLWVAGSDSGSCSPSETSNNIVSFERNSKGSLQFLSVAKDSPDPSARLDDITGLAATVDAKSPLYAISRAESAVSYLRYNSEDEELVDPAPVVEGDLNEDGTLVTGLQGATQLAISRARQGFMFVGGSSNKVGSFARISELELDLNRTNHRIEPGRGLRMTAHITNLGPADARDVELEVFYPGGFILSQNPSIEGESQTIECDFDSGSFKCQLFGIPVGDNRRVSFIFKPQRTGEATVTLVARGANRVTFEEIQAIHEEKIQVGSFKNGGAIAMSPWVFLLALPLLWRRRD
ncbi:MAG: hypothetical protein ACQES2_11245 [Pseudomonadota bacterium]